MGRGDDNDRRADSLQGGEEMTLASREGTKRTTAEKKTPA